MYLAPRLENRLKISRNGAGDKLLWSRNSDSRRRFVSDSDSTESPPPESLLPRPPPPDKSLKFPERKYSSCSCRRSASFIRKRSESAKRDASECDLKSVTIHQLEVKLYNMELEEAACMEDMDKVQERFNRSTQILETLTLYTQSLDLKARSFARLSNLTETFAYRDITATETLLQAHDKLVLDIKVLKQLGEIQSSLAAVSQTPDLIYQLMEDLREKRKQQHSATNTFSRYLRSCGKVSSRRLAKYEGEYETIRANCEQSRKNLEREVTKIINNRQADIVQELSKLVPIQEKLKEQGSQFCTLCQEITKCLQGPFKKKSCENICMHNKQPNRMK